MHIFQPEELIDLWFREDIGEGDHTTLSTIPSGANGSASLLVKEGGIVAGVAMAELIFRKSDPGLKITVNLPDGTAILPGDIVLTAEGNVRSILQSERLVLNVMQRMSGIATETSKYVKALEGTGTRVLDTRKTTPGFRLMEKEAVRLGGGVNHRTGLYDMILIKDNHIDFAGGIVQAIERAVQYRAEKQLDLQIEVEARSLEDVEKVLGCNRKVDRILLDNFTLDSTRQAVKIIDGRIETESSGGITFKTLRAYAECGVDYISAGALTHQIKSLDLSLKADF
ncbi:MAG: carboxylating nicotinate-nucleotide diphosphorylase [Bacteroidales bacterium]